MIQIRVYVSDTFTERTRVITSEEQGQNGYIEYCRTVFKIRQGLLGQEKQKSLDAVQTGGD